MTRKSLLGVVCGIAAATTLLGQAYGTGSQITVIPASAFQPESSGLQWSSYYGIRLRPTVTADTAFDAPLELPNGAVVTEIRFLVEDGDASLDVSAGFFEYAQPTSGSTTYSPGYFWQGSTTGSPGTTILSITGSPQVLPAIQFSAYDQYYLHVVMKSPSHALSGAVVVWHRQVSPAPGAATFNDVPTSDPFFRAIEALAASGITSGCGNNNFCPNAVVTRNQLAKFFANALGLHFPQ